MCFAYLRHSTQKIYSLGERFLGGETFCADTIAAQGVYIEKMIKHGCNSVDMESAAFFGSAKAAGISAAAVMQVSDNAL